MRRQDRVGQGAQWRRHVRLVLEDVKRGGAKPALGQRRHQGGFVDQGAAGDIDEHSLGAECRQHLGVDGVAGGGGGGGAQDQIVAARRQFQQRGCARDGAAVDGARLEVGELHAERRQAGGDGLADAAEAEDAGGLAAQAVGRLQAGAGRPVAAPHIGVHRRQAALRGQQQQHGEVGDVVGQHPRRVADLDAARGQRRQVDLVDADAVDHHHFQPRQAGDQAGVQADRPHRPHGANAGGDSGDHAALPGRRVLPHVMAFELQRQLRHHGRGWALGENENVGFGHDQYGRSAVIFRS